MTPFEAAEIIGTQLHQARSKKELTIENVGNLLSGQFGLTASTTGQFVRCMETDTNALLEGAELWPDRRDTSISMLTTYQHRYKIVMELYGMDFVALEPALQIVNPLFTFDSRRDYATLVYKLHCIRESDAEFVVGLEKMIENRYQMLESV